MTYEEKLELVDSVYFELELREKAKPILFNTAMVRAILDGKKTQTRRFANINTTIPCLESYNDHKFIRDDFSEHPYTGYVCKHCGWGVAFPHCRYPVGTSMFRPRYNEGDILYVRETWYRDVKRFMYRANYSDEETFYRNGKEIEIKWKPSIHMPKIAARIFLKVTAVRLERLQDITEQDAEREGICRMFDRLTDEEYERWAKAARRSEKKNEWGWNNYLWHGHFGTYGTGNKLSDAWEYQMSGYDSARDSFSSLWNSTLPLKDWDDFGWNANPWVWVYEFERIEVKR